MEEMRHRDAKTIAELRDQISIAGNSTLSKLHEAATRMESKGARKTTGQKKANADLFMNDR